MIKVWNLSDYIMSKLHSVVNVLLHLRLQDKYKEFMVRFHQKYLRIS